MDDDTNGCSTADDDDDAEGDGDAEDGAVDGKGDASEDAVKGGTEGASENGTEGPGAGDADDGEGDAKNDGLAIWPATRSGRRRSKASFMVSDCRKGDGRSVDQSKGLITIRWRPVGASAQAQALFQA